MSAKFCCTFKYCKEIIYKIFAFRYLHSYLLKITKRKNEASSPRLRDYFIPQLTMNQLPCKNKKVTKAIKSYNCDKIANQINMLSIDNNIL